VRGSIAYQRLLSVLHALRDRQAAGTPAILFVDHTHCLLGGDFERYPFDLGNVLKPLLHRCQIQLWGACALAEYRTSIVLDAAMQRCFREGDLPSVRAR